MDELKPCPFCGKQPRMKRGLNSEGKPFFQVTHDCVNLLSQIKTFCYRTEAEVVTDWNRRAAPENQCRLEREGKQPPKSCGDCKYIKQCELCRYDSAVPENKPLTVEQLRKMDGEPVWVREMAVWALVATCGTSIWLRFNSGDAKYISSADGYEIYVRKPEESEKG